MPAPTRVDAVRNRERLLGAALRVFTTHGAAAPLDQVARSAGVGRGTLYRHFPDRSSLFAALFDRRLDVLEPLIEDTPADTALDQLLVEICWYGHDVAGLGAVLSAMSPLENGRLSGIGQRTETLISRTLERSTRAGAARDGLAPADVEMVVVMLSAAVGSPGPRVPDHVVTRALQLALDGIRSPARWDLGPPEPALRQGGPERQARDRT